MRGYVEIELGGKTRTLHFDANAICDLEERMGRGIGAIMSEEAAGFYTVRALLWAGLKHEDRGLTLERAGRLLNDYIIGGGDQAELGKAIQRALRESGLFGKPRDSEDDEGNVKAEAAQ